MSYTFDPLSGATRDQLVELVIANSFSSGRYTEFARTWLNDAVTDVCRRLKIHRGMDILDHAADGTVDQPDAAPYFHVEELWLARSDAAGSGEQAVAQYARYQLTPLPTRTPAGLTGTPAFYTVRRQAFTGRSPEPVITVVPASAAGKVAIVGLQRPAPMDTADDLSGLGADLDDALVAFTKARAFRAEDDFEMSDRWKLEYDACLRSALQLPGQSDGPITTPGAWHEGLLADGGR